MSEAQKLNQMGQTIRMHTINMIQNLLRKKGVNIETNEYQFKQKGINLTEQEQFYFKNTEETVKKMYTCFGILHIEAENKSDGEIFTYELPKNEHIDLEDIAELLDIINKR